VRVLAETGSDRGTILPILAGASEPDRGVRMVAAKLAGSVRPDAFFSMALRGGM
jgi:ABC-type taurine transport system ATPase subunit